MLLPNSPAGADATEAAPEGMGGASAKPADMEATDGARDQSLPRTEPAGVAGPDRGAKAGAARFKLFSLGAIEALLGPAVEVDATTGFCITLKERDGEAGMSGDLLDDAVVLDDDGCSTGAEDAALTSGTALG